MQQEEDKAVVGGGGAEEIQIIFYFLSQASVGWIKMMRDDPVKRETCMCRRGRLVCECPEQAGGKGMRGETAPWFHWEGEGGAGQGAGRRPRSSSEKAGTAHGKGRPVSRASGRNVQQGEAGGRGLGGEGRWEAQPGHRGQPHGDG